MKTLYHHYHSEQDRLLVNQELLLLTMGMMAMVITLMMGRAIIDPLGGRKQTHNLQHPAF